MNKHTKKFIECEMAKWFDWCDKSMSGNLGYPSGSRFEPTSHSNKKCDPTPNQAIPDGLVFIDALMMDMERQYRQVMYYKVMSKDSDDTKAHMLNMSTPQYYNIVNRALEFAHGYLKRSLSDRRLMSVPNKEMV